MFIGKRRGSGDGWILIQLSTLLVCIGECHEGAAGRRLGG
jgi:hypothetical protein